MLLWEEQLTGIEIEPGVYRYEVTLHDYTMKLACIVSDPAAPVRATLKMIDGFYYLSIVDANGRNLTQFCRKT